MPTNEQDAASVYERARRHGFGHEKALACVEAGRVECWCGNPTPCIGGAQRFVGCAYEVSHLLEASAHDA